MANANAVRCLFGANRYAAQSVVICPVDLGGIAPWLARHTPDSFQAFCRTRFAEYTDAPEVAESVTEMFAEHLLALVRALQRRAQTDEALHGDYEIQSDTRILLRVGFERKDIAGAAMQYALALLHRAIGGNYATRQASAAAQAQFDQIAERYSTTLSARAVIKAARTRGIAADRLGQDLVVFGEGRFQQRRVRGFSDRTSHISARLTSDKSATLRMLASRGMPVPRQVQTRSADEAVRAAQSIGFPVVVKPIGSDYGNGVSLNLGDAVAVRDAWSRAASFGPTVLVEEQISGHDHRILVIDGKFYGAVQRHHPYVIGDGKQTVRALIDTLNADPRRGKTDAAWLVTIELDGELPAVLAAQGQSLASVPGNGDTVRLSRVASVLLGGDAVDLTASIHPHNVALAEWITALFGIDICGIDFVSEDVSQPYHANGAAVCEVNTTPALRSHVAAGDTRILDTIVETMYPPGAPFAVRKIVLVADPDSAVAIEAASALQAHFTGDDAVVGLSTFGRLRVNDIALKTGRLALPVAAQTLVAHPAVDTVILLCSARDIESGGLGIDACEVAALIDGESTRSDDDLRLSIEAAASIAGTVVRVPEPDASAEAVARAVTSVIADT